MRIRGFGVIAFAFLGGGCFATRSDVRVLQDDVLAFRAEAARADSARARQLEAIVQSMDRAMTILNDSVQEISARLGRFQGDNRQELYSVEQQLLQIQELTGQSQRRLQDIRGAIESRNQQAAMATPTVAPGDSTAPAAPVSAPREGPYQLWTLANEQKRQGSYATAREVFPQIVTNYPESELAPEAQYWIAEMFASEGKTAQADSAYHQVVTKYPTAPQAATALFKIGKMLENQGKCDEARKVMDQVSRQFPRSDEATLLANWRCGGQG